MNTLPPNTLLQGGKYKIEEKIGQGGFGITYRACQPLMLGRKVCIKEFCLKQHFSRDSTTSAITYPNDTARKDAEMFQQKFIKEAQTLYSMRHPNIMEIYDIFEENNTAYYVMEYIEGESLKDMLERRGCIPEAEAIGYIHKVAEALKYIHSRNINHFDVKPANILVRSSDKEVILIDFGTAKHYDSTTGNATTMTSGLLSPGYAPIEQYQQGGVSAFTPETDIYALGATLYKLLTGNTPPEPTEIISNGLPELPLTVTKATTDLVKWAMQLNKANRPHTCDEFLDNLPSEMPDVTTITIEESDADRGVEDESTLFIEDCATSEDSIGTVNSEDNNNPEVGNTSISNTSNSGLWVVGAIIFIIVLIFSIKGCKEKREAEERARIETAAAAEKTRIESIAKNTNDWYGAENGQFYCMVEGKKHFVNANGIPDGQRTVHYDTKNSIDSFTGIYKDGKMFKGKLKFKNGDYFDGTFYVGIRDTGFGRETLYFYIYEGNFLNRQHHGEGTLYFYDHTYRKSRFKYGEEVEILKEGTWK